MYSTNMKTRNNQNQYNSITRINERICDNKLQTLTMLTSLAATPKILDKIGPERYLCLSKAEKDLRCPRTFFRDTY